MDPEKRKLYESYLSSPPAIRSAEPAPSTSPQERMDRLMAPPPSASDVRGSVIGAMSRPVGSEPYDGGLPASAYVDMPTGEYLSRTARALPGSVIQMGSDILSAVTDPAQTLSSIYELGRGAASKATGIVFDQDPTEKADREAMLDALIGHYKNTYAGEPGSFWKALAEDPAAIGSDIATLAGIGAPTKLGVVSKGAKLAQNLVSKGAELAQNLDPIQAAMNAAGAVIPKVATRASSIATGVPYDVNKIIQAASRTPEGRAAVRMGLSAGNRIGDYTLPIVRDASNEMMEAAKARYVADAANASAVSRQVDLSPVMKRADELRNEISVRPSGNAPPYSADDVRAANEAYSMFENQYTHPDPAMRTIMPLDQLKKDIRAKADAISNPYLRQHVQRMAGSISEANSATDPVYGKMMSDWESHLSEMKDIERDLLGKSISSSAAAKRISRAFSDPYKASLLNEISQRTQSGKYLREILAGQASSPMMSDRYHSASGLIAGLLPAAFMHPAAAAMVVPSMTATSPRTAANAQLMAGLAAPYAGAVRNTLMSAPATNIASQLGEAEREAEREMELYGPRVQRRSGGRVAVDHAREAQSLIVAAERAKKEHNGSTEAILHTPDEHVVKALEVANRSI